jgi:hypothetical protein
VKIANDKLVYDGDKYFITNNHNNIIFIEVNTMEPKFFMNFRDLRVQIMEDRNVFGEILFIIKKIEEDDQIPN